MIKLVYKQEVIYIDSLSKKSLIFKILLVLAIILGIVIFLYLHKTENKLAFLLMEQDFVSNREREAVLLLGDRMIGSKGLVYQTIERGKTVNAHLLESMGQLLEYAGYTGNKGLRDETLRLIFKYFATREGYLSWQICDGRQQKATALIDVLRVLKVLIEEERDKENQYYINKVKDSLYNFNLKDDSWVDFYDGRHSKKADRISLFYIDIEIMKKLAREDERFFKPLKQAEEILMNSPVNEHGFFPQAYNYKKREYIYSPSINMVENILTSMYYCQNGGDIAKFVSFLKRELDKGHIYNRYHYDAQPCGKEESTAVYALACQLFMQTGDGLYADMCYKKMLSFQIKSGGLKGGFGDLASQTLYAYDQLEALKTMRMKEGKR